MKNNLVPILKNFIEKEKIDLAISKENSYEFWLDDSFGTITIRFKVNNPKHEILYDVYLPQYSVHLKEETIKDVEYLGFQAEENRRWKIVESIENIWLVLDEIKLWAIQNNYKLMEKQLI
jgi:hypothetical protein